MCDFCNSTNPECELVFEAGDPIFELDVECEIVEP